MSIGNWFYIFVMITVILTSVVAIKFYSSSRDLISYCFIILISLILGFRSLDSGTDTRAYVDYFNNIYGSLGDFEIGFEFLTIAINEIGGSGIYLFLICLFTLIFISISAKLTQTNQLITIFSTLSFVHGFDLLTNGIRNGLAVSLSVLLIVAVTSYNRNVLVRIFAPALGGFIHVSSYVFPLLAMILWRNFQSKSVLLFLCILALGSLFLGGQFAIDIILNYAILHAEGVGFLNKAARYVLLDQEILSQHVKYYFLAISAIITFVILYFYGLLSNEAIKLLARIGILGFVTSATLFFSAFSYRFFVLFFIPQILVFSHILGLNSISVKWKFVMLIFVLMNFIVTYTTNSFVNMNLLAF